MYHTKKMDPKLYEAAKESNVDVLKQYKDQLGVQLTANNSTVLHVAAQFHDRVECVEEILNLQPSLLCRVNSKRETALHIAARNGHSNTVEVLIQQTKSFKGGLNIFLIFFSPYLVWRLLYLVWRLSYFVGRSSWLGVQISKKMMIWIPNKHNDTALHEAVRNNHLEVVKMLVKEDALSPHVVNNFGESPLYIAAKKQKDSHCHANIVSKILEDCESPAHSGPDGTTALHAAVIAGCPECTKKILEKKPKLIYKADLDGWTPLHYAAREGHTDIMQEILSHSPDCWEIVNAKGHNILHIAKEHKKERVITFIGSQSVENSSIENQMGNEGNTPFILPLSRDMKNSWLSNLENQMDNDGNTPFNLPATSNEGSTSIIGGNKPKEDYNTTRDTHLLVAALIATVTFTAGLTLPGGYKGDEGPDQGTALLVRIAAFKAFVITNAIAMALSVSAIFVYLFPLDAGRPEKIGEELFSGFSLIVDAMFAMIIAFMTGSYAVLSNSSDLAVGVLIIGSSVPFLTSSLKRYSTGAAMRKVKSMSYSCIRKMEVGGFKG